MVKTYKIKFLFMFKYDLLVFIYAGSYLIHHSAEWPSFRKLQVSPLSLEDARFSARRFETSRGKFGWDLALIMASRA